MLGMELVENRDSKKPINAEAITKVREVAYENGALMRMSGPNFLMSPPLVVTTDDIDVILNALEAGFNAV